MCIYLYFIIVICLILLLFFFPSRRESYTYIDMHILWDKFHSQDSLTSARRSVILVYVPAMVYETYCRMQWYVDCMPRSAAFINGTGWEASNLTERRVISKQSADRYLHRDFRQLFFEQRIVVWNDQPLTRMSNWRTRA